MHWTSLGNSITTIRVQGGNAMIAYEIVEE